MNILNQILNIKKNNKYITKRLKYIEDKYPILMEINDLIINEYKYIYNYNYNYNYESIISNKLIIDLDYDNKYIIHIFHYHDILLLIYFYYKFENPFFIKKTYNINTIDIIFKNFLYFTIFNSKKYIKDLDLFISNKKNIYNKNNEFNIYFLLSIIKNKFIYNILLNNEINNITKILNNLYFNEYNLLNIKIIDLNLYFKNNIQLLNLSFIDLYKLSNSQINCIDKIIRFDNKKNLLNLLK